MTRLLEPMVLPTLEETLSNILYTRKYFFFKKYDLIPKLYKLKLGWVKQMNHYEILRIHSSATTEEIRKHYYKYAKMYHPDKHSGDLEKTEYFKKLSEAYATLSNPKKRYIYDMKLRTQQIPELQKIFEIKFSDEDLLVIQKYYEKLNSSTEFKFLKILYESLPETSKTNLKKNLVNGLKHIKTTLFQTPKQSKEKCMERRDR